ncbi:MAG: FAD:protein FMN transferase, partial [Nitrospiraceae bacterium]|nr:FAD:protein FMN transferase [Nitrospiraceae bacterium]
SSKIFILLFTAALLALSCENREALKEYKSTHMSMDTLVSLTLVAESAKKADSAAQAAFKEIDKLHKQLDFFSKDSEVSMINDNAGIRPVVISDNLVDLLEKVLLVSHNSKGAFDITTGPVNELWDFHSMIVPTDRQIKQRLPLINYRNIEIDKDRSTVFLKKKGMKIDLGGIAKGYAADRLTKIVTGAGIKSGIVAVGGDIRVIGKRPDGSLWRIGIKNPRMDKNKSDLLGSVRLSDKSISTSGDYERFFTIGSRRYHHLIDPATGYPSDRAICSTVITEDSSFADALATAVFILGPQKGIELLNKTASEGIIMDAQGKIHATEGIRDKIEYIWKP